MVDKGVQTMIDRFKHIDLNNEKVQRIINCGFEEFSKQPYEKASTNQIVKDAGVSRGLLYHYFKDKEELYDFLIYYSMKLAVEELENKVQWGETDFLNRMRYSIVLRLEWMNKYPYLFEFFNTIDNKKVMEYKEQMVSEEPEFREKFYHYNLDFSRLKTGVDVHMMINLTRFTIKQISKEHMDRVIIEGKDIDKDALMKEIDMYLDFIRKTFYEQTK